MNCENCSNEMRELKGISKKNGRPYHFFKCEACGKIENIKEGLVKMVTIEDTKHQEIIAAIKIVNENLKVLIKDFRDFAIIFGQKQTIDKSEYDDGQLK